MPRTPRRRVAEGIYRDRYSLTAVVKVHGHRKELAFPIDEPLKAIQKWRLQERARMLDDAPAPTLRGTLAADVRVYLTRVAKRPASLPAKRSELKAWIARLGRKPRSRITPSDVDAAIAAWLVAGVAPKTITNRCRTLRHLFVTLANDRRARTPFDNVDLPRAPERRPAFVAAATIAAVAARLTPKTPADRARAAVVHATGIRPSQLARVTRADVDVRAGHVTARGKGGRRVTFPITAATAPAWRAFVDARAFGPFDPLVATPAADRARYMVMASTGIRPSQLARLTAADVDLERGLVVIAGGKGGRPIVHVLNGDMRAAWRAFIAADAWGPFDTSRLARRLRAAGWPTGIRVYNAKHSIGIELAERGADMTDIQSWFGHTSTGTTRIYTGVPLERMRALSASLDGRLGWDDGEPSA